MNYCWSLDGEHYEANEEHETRLGARQACIEVNGVTPGSTIYTAEQNCQVVKDFLDVDRFLEDVGEQARESVGEGAGDWPNLTIAQEGELETMIAEYIAKCDPIYFWGVKNPEKHVVGVND